MNQEDANEILELRNKNLSEIQKYIQDNLNTFMKYNLESSFSFAQNNLIAENVIIRSQYGTFEHSIKDLISIAHGINKKLKIEFVDF